MGDARHLCTLRLALLCCPECTRDWRHPRLSLQWCGSCAHIRAATDTVEENKSAPWLPPDLIDWTPLVVHPLKGQNRPLPPHLAALPELEMSALPSDFWGWTPTSPNPLALLHQH